MAYLQNTSIVGTLNVSDVSTFSSSGGIRFNDTMINIGASLAATASGANSIAIGYNASATGKYGVAIGSGASATTGTNINSSSSATTGIYIGRNSHGSSVYVASSGTAWTFGSDINDKTDIETIPFALSFLNSLDAITYVDNNRNLYVDEENGDTINKSFNEDAWKQGLKKGTRRRVGVKAQQVYDALKKYYGSDNYAALVDYNKYDNPDLDEFDRYAVSYGAFIPFLIRAIQELDEKNNKLEEEITFLKKELEKNKEE